MRRLHGWTSIACATALTLSATLTASPAAQARRPGRHPAPKPALATGTSTDPDASWRLEGRRLTVRFAEPLRLPGDVPEAELEVRCGDNATRDGYAWHLPVFADSAERRIRVAAGARSISVVLAQDVAARTDLCVLRDPNADRANPYGALFESARLRLLRGTAPGCKPTRAERVVHRGRDVVVTGIRSAGPDGTEDVFRYCRLPGGRFTPLADLRPTSMGRTHEPPRFASAGRWLAWTSDTRYAPTPSSETAVEILDVRSSTRAKPTRFDGWFDAPVAATTGLDLSAVGTAVWTRRVVRGDAVTLDLQVGWQHGRHDTLATWTGPAAEEAAHALTDPAISEDGRTVTWREAGQPRSASAAVPDESDSSARSAIAFGASTRPAARFRLSGRDLTVTFDRRLTPRGFRGRPSVRVVCGDSVTDPAGIRSLDWPLLAAKGERSLRVSPGARILRARLDANVADRANWCALRLRSRAGNRFAGAGMRLREGTPAGCVPTAREHVLLDSDQLLVTSVTSRPTQGDEKDSALRACAKATKVRRALGTSHIGFGDGVWTELAASAGARLAVTTGGGNKYHQVQACTLETIDMAQTAPRLEPVAIAPDGEPQFGRCAGPVALAADGRVAWIVTTTERSAAEPSAPQRIAARTADGRTVVLATAANTRWDALTDLAISADGTTVTWREEGVDRSAPLP